VKKWDVLVTANDGRKFYQNIHVIESNPESASVYVQENFPERRIRQTVNIENIEMMEDAELFLPGIVYRSGKAYFNA
jgi:hypothetical protein